MGKASPPSKSLNPDYRMADNDQPTVPDIEIVITMIAGVIHRWQFWPGIWEQFNPQPGDLLRVWKDSANKPPKPK